MSDAPAPQSTSHQNSADRIWMAIADLYADCEQDPNVLITYALCDLRHLCDWLKLQEPETVNFEGKIKESLDLYKEEKTGD